MSLVYDRRLNVRPLLVNPMLVTSRRTCSVTGRTERSKISDTPRCTEVYA